MSQPNVQIASQLIALSYQSERIGSNAAHLISNWAGTSVQSKQSTRSCLGILACNRLALTGRVKDLFPLNQGKFCIWTAIVRRSAGVVLDFLGVVALKVRLGISRSLYSAVIALTSTAILLPVFANADIYREFVSIKCDELRRAVIIRSDTVYDGTQPPSDSILFADLHAKDDAEAPRQICRFGSGIKVSVFAISDRWDRPYVLRIYPSSASAPPVNFWMSDFHTTKTLFVNIGRGRTILEVRECRDQIPCVDSRGNRMR
jgi:hypothetical protein